MSVYRYILRRQLGRVETPPCLFVMLNPSTADEVRNDPTVRRCIGFANHWVCSELRIINLFGLRATDPKELFTAVDPVGPGNFQAVRDQLALNNLEGGILVAAWGAHKMASQSPVYDLVLSHRPKCLGQTSTGAPRHPLYLPSKTSLVSFQSPWEPQVPRR